MVVMVWSGCDRHGISSIAIEWTWSRVAGPVVDLVDQKGSGRL